MSEDEFVLFCYNLWNLQKFKKKSNANICVHFFCFLIIKFVISVKFVCIYIFLKSKLNLNCSLPFHRAHTPTAHQVRTFLSDQKSWIKGPQPSDARLDLGWWGTLFPRKCPLKCETTQSKGDKKKIFRLGLSKKGAKEKFSTSERAPCAPF